MQQHKRLALSAFFLLLLALLHLGCDSAPNPIAPTGTTLSITANPARISLSGESSMITVSGFRPDGNPLNPDTQLTVSTSLGVLRTSNNINGANANIVRVDGNGRASFFLFGDGRQGTATIAASLTLGGGGTTTGGGTDGGTGAGTTGGGSSVSLDVLVGDDATTLPTVTVTANPTEVDVNQTSFITVTARQVDGQPLVGETAIIRTSLGNLSFPNGTTTNSEGIVSARLTSSQSGTAEVTASVGSSAEASAMVEIGTTRMPMLEITANPSILDANGRDNGVLVVNANGESRITVIARDNNGNPVGGGQRISITTDLGSATSSSSVGTTVQPEIASVNTDGNGEARFFFRAGTRAGTGNVTAILGNSAPATVNITIRTSPAVVNLEADTRTVAPSGAARSLSLTVTVTDNEGLPVGGELVFFRIANAVAGPNGTAVPGNFIPAGGASTNTQGEASATLNFGENQTIDATSFEIIARVREVDSQPVTIEVR